MKHLLLLLLLTACQNSTSIPAASAQAPKPKAPSTTPNAEATSVGSSPASASVPSTNKKKTEITIIDKFIPFDDTRKKLTLEYIQEHYDPKATSIEIAPKMIILHWTGGGGSAKGTISTFSGTYIESARAATKKASDLNVSSQFVIDRDGTIYRLMPETTMARHCIGLNLVSIGVENVGGGDKRPLTEAQLKSNIALVHYLKETFPDIEYLIGHLEYRAFEGTPLFMELDPKYRNNKPDPGPDFMKKVREAVKELSLKGPPEKKSK